MTDIYIQSIDEDGYPGTTRRNIDISFLSDLSNFHLHVTPH